MEGKVYLENKYERLLDPMGEEREFHTFRGYQMQKRGKRFLTPSMEDYMEMIYRFCLEDGYIRINQLAERLNVQAPSATKNVQKLTKLGLLDYQKYGVIQLTEQGKKIGKFLLHRHMIIENFLRKIGVEDTLLRDTEMIEHNISMDALKNIQLFDKFLEENPDILERYMDFRKSNVKK